MSHQDSLKPLVNQVELFLHTALKRWSEQGFDHTSGGFIECLDFDGKPLYQLNKRVRVQARQTFVYALAASLGYGDHWADLAQQACEFMQKHYWHTEGGWMNIANRDGTILEGSRNAYEQAFALLALGELAKLKPQGPYQQQRAATWQFLERHLHNHQYGGFNLSQPNTQALPRQQNPHMHLFEACLHNFALTQDEQWRQRTQPLFELFQQHFFDHQEGCLREFFNEDWSLDSQLGNHLEPGHHHEWVWLLGQYEKLTGNPVPQQTLLYQYANRYGGDAHTTFAVDEMLPQGKTSRPTKRLWVQTEVLKSHITMFEKTSSDKILMTISQHLQNIFKHYLLIDQGSWFDRLDENNQNISENAPASTFYHLFLAFSEFLRVFK